MFLLNRCFPSTNLVIFIDSTCLYLSLYISIVFASKWNGLMDESLIHWILKQDEKPKTVCLAFICQNRKFLWLYWFDSVRMRLSHCSDAITQSNKFKGLVNGIQKIGNSFTNAKRTPMIRAFDISLTYKSVIHNQNEFAFGNFSLHFGKREIDMKIFNNIHL